MAVKSVLRLSNPLASVHSVTLSAVIVLHVPSLVALKSLKKHSVSLSSTSLGGSVAIKCGCRTKRRVIVCGILRSLHVSEPVLLKLSWLSVFVWKDSVPGRINEWKVTFHSTHRWCPLKYLDSTVYCSNTYTEQHVFVGFHVELDCRKDEMWRLMSQPWQWGCVHLVS